MIVADATVQKSRDFWTVRIYLNQDLVCQNKSGKVSGRTSVLQQILNAYASKVRLLQFKPDSDGA